MKYLFLLIGCIIWLPFSINALHSSQVSGVKTSRLASMIGKNSQYGFHGPFAIVNDTFRRNSNNFLHQTKAHYRIHGSGDRTTIQIRRRAGEFSSKSGPKPKNRVQYKVVSDRPSFSDISAKRYSSPITTQQTASNADSTSFQSVTIN